MCPDNSKPSEAGATECQCEDGFHRSPSDPPTSPCSGNGRVAIPSLPVLIASEQLKLDAHRLCALPAPPSAPRDLSSSALSAEGRLQLSWSPPLVTGGRGDLTYSVACAHCSEGQCVPCGEKVRFEPGAADLQETTVVVTDLDPHLNYTFTVEAHSGVSQFSSEKAVASLTTAVDHTGEFRRCGITRISRSTDISPRMLSHTERRGLPQRNLVSPTQSSGICSPLPGL